MFPLIKVMINAFSVIIIVLEVMNPHPQKSLVLPGQEFSPWIPAACWQHPCWRPCTQRNLVALWGLTGHPNRAEEGYQASEQCDCEKEEEGVRGTVSCRSNDCINWLIEKRRILPVELLSPLLSVSMAHETVSEYGSQMSVLCCLFLFTQMLHFYTLL